MWFLVRQSRRETWEKISSAAIEEGGEVSWQIDAELRCHAASAITRIAVMFVFIVPKIRVYFSFAFEDEFLFSIYLFAKLRCQTILPLFARVREHTRALSFSLFRFVSRFFHVRHISHWCRSVKRRVSAELYYSLRLIVFVGLYAGLCSRMLAVTKFSGTKHLGSARSSSDRLSRADPCIREPFHTCAFISFNSCSLTPAARSKSR